MPSLSQIKQFLSLTVLPVLAASASTWLVVHLHFLAAFHLTAASITGELTQLGVWGISAGLTWLASHHVLKGTYNAPHYIEVTLEHPADRGCDADAKS